MRLAFRFLAALAIALPLATAASAADIVEHSTSYGPVGLPFTTNFGQTYIFPNAPTPGDRFVDDYGFIVSEASFSSIAATFDLGSILSIGGLSMRLIAGDPFAGMLPHALSAGELIARATNTLATSSGSSSVQTISPFALAPGHYFLEVSGLVNGSFGGSYGGVLNLVPVPEAQGATMALAGLAMLGFLVLRRRA